MDELQVQLAIAVIARQFDISTEQATLIYLDFLKHKKQELENHLGRDTFAFLRTLLADEPSLGDLIHGYHKLKADGGLVSGKLVKDQLIYMRSLDVIGEKLFLAGTAMEVTKTWISRDILEVWMSEDCCTYLSADSVELNIA